MMMHVTQWKEPALTWNGTVPEHGRASILEIRSDDFIPQFLQAMGSDDPAAYFNKHRIDKTASSLKLYQPLHGCYYLVTASLVCRQLGLPDKAIRPSDGESVFFVIRRRTADGGEEAWIPFESEKGGRWKLLADDKALTLAKGEERLPMHPVKICPKPQTPHSVFTDNIERELYYGYIPVGNRDKYKDTVGRTLTSTPAPADLVNDFIAQAEADSPEPYNFRLDLYLRRVHLPWRSLLANSTSSSAIVLPVAGATTAEEQQLYTILELGDFLKNNLPTLWAALKAGSSASLPMSLATLFNTLTADLQAENLTPGDSDPFLSALLLDYEAHFDLVRGQGSIPPFNYDLHTISSGDVNDLRDDIEAAVEAETAPIKLTAGADSELVRLITNQVQPQPQPGEEPLYHIRTVYEYDPDCPPVVSTLATRPFQLTKFFEPGAPARLVRIEAPSIKPRDLRQYARGVGIEMSPELHKLASCMGGDTPQDVIDSVGSCNNGGLSIQMICTFSIQIIFLVAFIVMFIFLISLNFIFWWLAYLRICLPIPTKD